MELAILFGIGFIVGLSGAMLPGPLLVYTIGQSLKRGPLTGAYVILGHAAVEMVILGMLLTGLQSIFEMGLFFKITSLLGGILLMIYSVSLSKTKFDINIKKSKSTRNTILGGIFFTAFNPGFPIWWATAGMRLIFEGLQRAGYRGVFAVVMGHWLADLSFYLLVSYLFYRGKQKLIKRHGTKIRGFLSAILAILGVYFLYTGLVA